MTGVQLQRIEQSLPLASRLSIVEECLYLLFVWVVFHFGIGEDVDDNWLKIESSVEYLEFVHARVGHVNLEIPVGCDEGAFSEAVLADYGEFHIMIRQF